MRFAPIAIANVFAAERAGNPADSFGYHGVFLMPQALGVEPFWEIYLSLDDRTTLRNDFIRLVRAVLVGKNPVYRVLALTARRLGDLTFFRH